MTDADRRPEEADDDRTLRPGEADGVPGAPSNGDAADPEAVTSSPSPNPSASRRAMPTQKAVAIDAPDVPDVRITGTIGRGGQGVVFRGHQEFLDRSVAVKVLFKSSDPDFSVRFRQEAVLLASFQHSNIVACHQAGVTEDDHCYMVLELVEGYDLFDYVKLHGALAEPVALGLVADIGSALRHGYEEHARTVHRDVKPQNVLLQVVQTDEGPTVRAKLVDLGLARCLEESAQITQPGVIMGTPVCMAPEQFDAPEKVDHRTDIYGLGCVLYYALTGDQAFKGKTLTQIYAEKSACRLLDSLGDLGISVGTRELLTRMLAPGQAERPQTHGELLDELQRLRSLCGTPSGRGTGRRRSVGVVASVSALAVVALAVAAGTGAFSSTDDRDAGSGSRTAGRGDVASDTGSDVEGGADTEVVAVALPPFAPALVAGQTLELLDDERFLAGWTNASAAGDDLDHWDPHQDMRGREPDGRTDHPQGLSRNLDIDWNAIVHGSATALWRPELNAIRHAVPEGDWEFRGVLSLTDSGNSPALVGGLRLVRDDGSFLEIALDARRDADPDEGFVPRLERRYRLRCPAGWYDAERTSLGDAHVDTGLGLKGTPHDGAFAFLDGDGGAQRLPDEVTSAEVRVTCTADGCDVTIGSSPVRVEAPDDFEQRPFRALEVFVGQGLMTVHDMSFTGPAD